MRAIALFAIISVAGAFAIAGNVPEGSVGGSMTMAVIVLAASLAVGLVDAVMSRPGVLRGLLGIVVAICGGILGNMIAGVVLVGALMLLNAGEGGTIMSQPPPLLQVSLAVWMFCVLTGSWLALKAVRRSRVPTGVRS